MPAQQGTVNVVQNDVFTVLGLPVSALAFADDNGDGRLSDTELRTHAAALQLEIPRRFALRDGDVPGHPVLVNVMAEPDERLARPDTVGAGGRHVVVLMRTQFPAVPRQLAVHTDLFGRLEGEDRLLLKATRGTETEALVLSPMLPRHRFFQPVWQVFSAYVGVGLEHILLGADHVLFLLTVVLATAGWRRLLWVLTGFTLAHSVTLVLSLLGWLRMPAQVVEPLIAASIVFMAGWHLLRLRHPRPATALGPQVGVVLVCGLLHGMGFAASLGDMGLHGLHPLVSLAGFNLGIELGQVAVAALSLGLLATWPSPRTSATVASVALLAGGYGLVDRLWG
jgi:hydrogenase/urease accessory protein HupE